MRRLVEPDRRAALALGTASLVLSCQPTGVAPVAPSAPSAPPEQHAVCDWRAADTAAAQDDVYEASWQVGRLPEACLAAGGARGAWLQSLRERAGLGASATGDLEAVLQELSKKELDPAATRQRQTRVVLALEREASARLGRPIRLAPDPGPTLHHPTRALWNRASDGPVVTNGVELAAVDLGQKNLRWRFAVPGARLRSFALHPSTPRVATCWSDGTLRQWDLERGGLEWVVPASGCEEVKYHLSAPRLAVRTRRQVTIHESTSGRVVAAQQLACSAITWTAAAPVLCVEPHGALVRWEAGQEPTWLPGEFPAVLGLEMSPDGEHLALMTAEALRWLDYPALAEQTAFRCGVYACSQLEFAPDGRLVVVDRGQSAEVYGTDQQRLWAHFSTGSGWAELPLAIALEPDGQRAFLAYQEGFLFFDLREGATEDPARSWQHSFALSSADWTGPAGLLPSFPPKPPCTVLPMAWSDRLTPVEVLDAATGVSRTLGEAKIPHSRTWQVPELAASGKTLAVITGEGTTVSLYDTEGPFRQQLEVGERLTGVRFASDAARLVTFSAGAIRWWRREPDGYTWEGTTAVGESSPTGREERSVSADARTVAVTRRVDQQWGVSVVELGIGTVAEYPERASAIALDASGRNLAIGAPEGTIVLRSRTGDRIVTEGQPGRVTRLEWFSPQGLLVSRSERQGPTRLFDTRTGQRVADVHPLRPASPFPPGVRPPSPPPDTPQDWFALVPVHDRVWVDGAGRLTGLSCRIGERTYPWALCSELLFRPGILGTQVARSSHERSGPGGPRGEPTEG